MRSFLVDDRGRRWTDNWDLARRIGYDDPQTDVCTFAVRERGYIHVRQRDGTARVSVREGRFSLLAFAAALLELGRMNPARIMLCVLSSDPPAFYIFTDLRDFGAQVEPLAAGTPLEMRLPRLAEARSLRVLNLPTFACARPIANLWKQTRGELSEDVTSALAAGGVLERMILVRQRPQSERLVTEAFGSAIKFLRASEIIGRDIDDQHDREYGAWMAETYAVALHGRRLRVESCQARIRKSAAAEVSVRYDRVLIPWRSTGGELFTMCVSIEREKPVEVSSRTLATF